MHEFWSIPPANVMYTRLQNHTNMMVSEHGIKTFEVMIIVLLCLLLSFDVFVPTSAHPLLMFGQVVCPKILKCEWWLQVL